MCISVALLLRVAAATTIICAVEPAQAEPASLETEAGDEMIAEYFQAETMRIANHCLQGVDSLEEWQRRRPEYRRQLLEMLGLDPLPQRTELNVEVTGENSHEEFTVRNLHFQSQPNLYVTANLYVPNEVSAPLPAVLYVCGHGPVKENGVSYGNKVHYQRHGAWFARNGYVCLVIDTIQLGEIEGIHHGTYRENMWWWLNRGYTPAGVEAWNCIRSIDYLQSLPEVDPDRIGVTGRSGGGAYSWWIAAIDERVKCAVPVAGVTDLENHVVDGCVEGHCDCMYFVNTYHWDYPMLAAMIAPRPLLISNTDRDPIFPLDGVYRTYTQAKKIYDLYDAEERLALNITAGSHDDTQELRVHAFRWLNRFLKDDDSLIEKTAVAYFTPQQLKVFEELPADERNTHIHDTFVTQETPSPPASSEAWETTCARWRTLLTEKVLGGWPETPCELDALQSLQAVRDGIAYRVIDFQSQDHIDLQVHVIHRAGLKTAEKASLDVLDEARWRELLGTLRPAFEDSLDDAPLPDLNRDAWQELRDSLQGAGQVRAYVAPRGVGPTRWDQSPSKQIQHQRRFYLLGQTLDGQRVYDVRRAVQALRAQSWMGEAPLELTARGPMAGVAVYAALLEPDIAALDLYELPASHRDGPYLLNVTRFFDMPQAVTMACQQTPVVLHEVNADDWTFPMKTAAALGWNSESIVIAP